MVDRDDEGEEELSSSETVQTQVQRPQRSYGSQAIVIPTLSVGSQPISLALP